MNNELKLKLNELKEMNPYDVKWHEVPDEIMKQIIKDGTLKEIVSEHARILDYIPKKYHTQELWNTFFVKSGGEISKEMDKKFLNEDLYAHLVANDPGAFRVYKMPAIFDKQKVWTLASAMNYEVALVTPRECQTYDIWVNFSNNCDRYQIGFIPKKYYSTEIFQNIFNRDPRSIKYIPKAFQTPKMMEALQADFLKSKVFRDEFLILPEEYLKPILDKFGKSSDFESQKQSFEENPYATWKNSRKTRTREMCDWYAERGEYYHDSIERIPEYMWTQDMWNKCSEIRGFNSLERVKQIPEEFQTQEMWDSVKFRHINDIPKRFRSQKIWEQYVRKNPDSLFDMPGSFLSEKLFIDLVKNNGLNVGYIVNSNILKRYLTPSILKEFYVEQNNPISEDLFKIDERLWTEELGIKYIVEKTSVGFDYDIKNVLNHFNSQKLWNFVFNVFSRDVLNVLNIMPREFQTQGMWQQAFEREDDKWRVLNLMPREFQIQAMWNEVAKNVSDKERFLESIPRQFVEGVKRDLGLMDKNQESKKESTKDENNNEVALKEKSEQQIIQHGRQNKYSEEKTNALKMVSKDGLALVDLPAHMRDDFNIVICAFNQNPTSLQYASRNVVLKFLSVNNFDENIVKFVSPSLKQDKDFIMEAIVKNPKAVHCCDVTISPDILALGNYITDGHDLEKAISKLNLVDDKVYKTFSLLTKKVFLMQITEQLKKRGISVRNVNNLPNELKVYIGQKLESFQQTIDKARETQTKTLSDNLSNKSNSAMEDKQITTNEQEPEAEQTQEPEVDVVQELIQINETPSQNQSETLRQKFDIKNEHAMNELYEFYAQINVAYYNKKDRTPEEIKRRRNINAQFKRIIDKKANALIESENNEESNFEQKIQEIKNGTLFPDNEIDEIVSSKGAIIKLFQIFASGIYEKNGTRTRLTQKQRCALANVLQKVSEKNLEIENAKLGKKDKLNKEANSALNINESEKGV